MVAVLIKQTEIGAPLTRHSAQLQGKVGSSLLLLLFTSPVEADNIVSKSTREYFGSDVYNNTLGKKGSKWVLWLSPQDNPYWFQIEPLWVPGRTLCKMVLLATNKDSSRVILWGQPKNTTVLDRAVGRAVGTVDIW